MVEVRACTSLVTSPPFMLWCMLVLNKPNPNGLSFCSPISRLLVVIHLSQVAFFHLLNSFRLGPVLALHLEVLGLGYVMHMRFSSDSAAPNITHSKPMIVADHKNTYFFVVACMTLIVLMFLSLFSS